MEQILYYLPCSVALIWCFSFSFKVKNHRQKFYLGILIVQVYYLLNYALFLSPKTDYLLMVKMDLINEPVKLALLACQVIYLRMHRYGTRLTTRLFPLFLPSVVYSSVISLIYFVVGFSHASEFARYCAEGGPMPDEFHTPLFDLLYLFEYPLLSGLTLIYFIASLSICYSILRHDGYRRGDLFRFFFRGGVSTPARVIAILSIFCMLALLPLSVLGHHFMTQHTVLSITTTLLLTIGLYCLCFVEFHSGSYRTITLYQLSHIQSQTNQQPATHSASADNQTQDTEDEEHDVHHLSPKMELLISKLRQLIEEEEIWRNDELNIQMLTDRLDVSRATLSNIINTIYGKPFRDVINHYRIEAVKQRLLEDPTAKQSTIAYECGFKNASYLNAKFKEIVGEPPLLWLAHQASAT